MDRKQLIEYKKTLALTELQKEVLVGVLLGDASIPKQRENVLHNVKFEQKLGNKEYVDHLYGIFKDWVGTPPSVREIRGGGAADRQSIWFRTYRHTSFSYYYGEFYGGGKKKVPALIHRYLTSRALAYWFMDDGTKAGSGYVISSHGFTLSNHKVLVNAIKLNFTLDVSIHRDGEHYKLYIPVKSAFKFVSLIDPYLVSSMRYKL